MHEILFQYKLEYNYVLVLKHSWISLSECLVNFIIDEMSFYLIHFIPHHLILNIIRLVFVILVFKNIQIYLIKKQNYSIFLP